MPDAPACSAADASDGSIGAVACTTGAAAASASDGDDMAAKTAHKSALGESMGASAQQKARLQAHPCFCESLPV